MNHTATETEGDTMGVMFGVLELVFSVSGLLLNSFTIRYFYSKITSPTYFLYLSIGQYLTVL